MTTANAFDLILPFFPAEVQPLLVDPSVSDLMINGGRVFVDHAGRMSELLGVFVEKEMLCSAIQRIAKLLGQDINEQRPILDTRLEDGSRVAAVYLPCSPGGPTVTIRKFNCWYTTDQLVEMGSLPQQVLDRIVVELLNRQNLLISGSTSSGKTTQAAALIRHIPSQERLIVIEKPIEMYIPHVNAVRWEAVDALPHRPAVTISQLVGAALRHRPDRIILGEVRDHSAYDLLQALNTGHGGSISTVHAPSALEALHRVSGLALSAHPNLSHEFVRAETVSAIHFVMHVQRGVDDRRRVVELAKVIGYSTSRQAFETDPIYKTV